MDSKRILTPRRVRILVQGAFTLFSVFIGIRFHQFLQWATGAADTFVPRPAAVEGFLPISALLGFRRFVMTGMWDNVHPAGLTIFMAALVMAFLFRKGFCGHLCPVGFLSRQTETLGKRFGLSIRAPRWLDLPLKSLKYLLLGFFIYFVFFGMSPAQVQEFMTTPYNFVADAKMLDFFLHPSGTTLGIIGLLAALGLILPNFWCRYLCPYGALLGLLSFLSPLRISRDRESCIACGKCTRACPGGIRVQDKAEVTSPECFGCTECIGACPVDGCLSLRAKGLGRVPYWTIPAGVVITLLGAYAAARLTGHWDANMPPFMLKKLYSMFLAALQAPDMTIQG